MPYPKVLSGAMGNEERTEIYTPCNESGVGLGSLTVSITTASTAIPTIATWNLSMFIRYSMEWGRLGLVGLCRTVLKLQTSRRRKL